jgi:uncharacterized membrane protein
MFGDDEFELNDDELSAESQLSIADEQKIKILETMKTKITQAIDNLKYSEKEEYKATFAVISRYVGAVIEIEQMEANEEISEEELLEAIEKIELTVKELSFQDLREIEKKNKTVEVEEKDDDNKKGPDLDDNFDF